VNPRAAAERVLRELPPHERLYAVLDGARDRLVRPWVIETRAAAWCLYRGDLTPALESAAPWLLRLMPGQPSTEQFFARAWNRAWGILIATSVPSRELRRHLRRFFVVRTEDKKKMLFRYYDPRVLRIFLPTCTPEEVTQFFGPISAMVAEAEEPDAFHVCRRTETGLEHRRVNGA
jgi:hypothetical protein